jgi:hypothetical protein
MVAAEFDAVGVDSRLLSSALSASISACIAANCLATAGGISGSPAGVGAVFEGSWDAATIEASVDVACAWQRLEKICKPRNKMEITATQKILHTVIRTVVIPVSP